MEHLGPGDRKPLAPQGWMSPDTVLRKTNVFLTSPGEPASLLCDLRPKLLLGHSFPTGTDYGCQRASSGRVCPALPPP